MNKAEKLRKEKLQLTAKELKLIETRFKDTSLVIFEEQQQSAKRGLTKPANYLQYSKSARYSAFGNQEILVPDKNKVPNHKPDKRKPVSKFCVLM